MRNCAMLLFELAHPRPLEPVTQLYIPVHVTFQSSDRGRRRTASWWENVKAKKCKQSYGGKEHNISLSLSDLKPEGSKRNTKFNSERQLRTVRVDRITHRQKPRGNTNTQPKNDKTKKYANLTLPTLISVHELHISTKYWRSIVLDLTFDCTHLSSIVLT